MAKKKVVKKVAKTAIVVEKKKKVQRYVAKRNVDLKKAEGWKVVDEKLGKHGRTLGIKSEGKDVILMEK